jgi:hypothetical protein
MIVLFVGDLYYDDVMEALTMAGIILARNLNYIEFV